MSGALGQKANPVKEFELIFSERDLMGRFYEASREVLLRLADNKENYAPACFEVFIKKDKVFGGQAREGDNALRKQKLKERAQPYLDRAVKMGYAPAEFAQAPGSSLGGARPKASVRDLAFKDCYVCKTLGDYPEWVGEHFYFINNRTLSGWYDTIGRGNLKLPLSF